MDSSPTAQKAGALHVDEDTISSVTKQIFNSVVEAGDEQTSQIKAFGSPHVGSPPPASPLDHAAKQLDFGVAAAKPATPASPSTPILTPGGGVASRTAEPVTPAPAGSTDAAVDYDAFIKDTLLWSHKVRSVVYLLGGLLLIYGTNRLLSSQISLVTGVCYLVLAQAGLNFIRAFINPRYQELCTWYDSAWTAAALSNVSAVVRGAAALHDRHLNGRDPAKMLKIVAVLWALSLAGRAVGLTWLITSLWVTLFILPKLYTLFKANIDKLVGDVAGQAKTHFFNLDSRVRAALVVVPIFAAGYALSAADLGVACLALCLYGRSCMQPAQVERLNAVVAPTITKTVGKIGGTVSRVVTNAANKYELTPTPMKKKMN